MSLKERITDDMKAAMRSGEKERLGVIRMITSAIKQREVDERIRLDDAQVLSVLEKMIKQRKESLVQFQAGNRQDLVDKESAEITLLQGYLPSQLSDAEIDALINEAIAATRRGQHQGYGQGHGHHQGQGTGPRRHGRRRGENQSPLKRLTARGPWPAAFHNAFIDEMRRALRHRRSHRRARAAQESGARIQGLLPVPQRKIAFVLGQSRQAVLSLLRLRRARHGDRLSHAIREDGVLRRRGGPGAAHRRSKCRARR